MRVVEPLDGGHLAHQRHIRVHVDARVAILAARVNHRLPRVSHIGHVVLHEHGDTRLVQERASRLLDERVLVRERLVHCVGEEGLDGERIHALEGPVSHRRYVEGVPLEDALGAEEVARPGRDAIRALVVSYEDNAELGEARARQRPLAPPALGRVDDLDVLFELDFAQQQLNLLLSFQHLVHKMYSIYSLKLENIF